MIMIVLIYYFELISRLLKDELTLGEYTFKYRQSSSMSITPLVAPVYRTGWGQAGPKSTA